MVVGDVGEIMNNAQATYLDVLRGFAAQLVLVGHIYSMVLFPGKTLGVGDLGVIVFFILSGFLITYTTLLKKHRGSYTFRNYIGDRFFRIFVPYLPAVIVIVSLDAYVYHYTSVTAYIEHYNLKDFVATLTMLQQHPVGLFLDKLLGLSEFKLATFGSGRPLWTVASEWWLYVVFGMVFFYSRQTTRFFLLLLFFLLAAIGPLFNAVAGTGQGLSLVWFLMSGLAYFYFKNGREIERKVTFFLHAGIHEKVMFYLFMSFLLVLMLVRGFWVSYVEPGFVFQRPIFYDFNLYLLLMIFFTLVFLVVGNVQLRVRNKVAMFIADYSYSLYLIHYTLLFFFVSVGFTTEDKVYDFIILYTLSNLMAIVFWWLFERHYRQVKQVFSKKFYAGR
jgi:peptidoglycan/LPS O-acetylase OafA/YrhL